MSAARWCRLLCCLNYHHCHILIVSTMFWGHARNRDTQALAPAHLALDGCCIALLGWISLHHVTWHSSASHCKPFRLKAMALHRTAPRCIALARPGLVWPGLVRPGLASVGMASLGWARLGWTRLGFRSVGSCLVVRVAMALV